MDGRRDRRRDRLCFGLGRRRIVVCRVCRPSKEPRKHKGQDRGGEQRQNYGTYNLKHGAPPGLFGSIVQAEKGVTEQEEYHRPQQQEHYRTNEQEVNHV